LDFYSPVRTIFRTCISLPLFPNTTTHSEGKIKIIL
jgi:hypothetical protein